MSSAWEEPPQLKGELMGDPSRTEGVRCWCGGVCFLCGAVGQWVWEALDRLEAEA